MKDSLRNDYIVSDYVNKKEYRKTLTFTDRRFQCEYIVEKLNELGVRENAVYSKIENSNEPYAEALGKEVIKII